ncbi:MAG: hypothetical protein EAX96_03605 [Candidatus Lokiarchaeota archaeon]|nr:hypothetical protein [Candidatus Lokiarchaeota archaeon]
MQSNDLREIFKRLIAFAQLEYKEKRPTSISGYLIKQVKGLSGSIPIINAYLNRHILSFFILSNFKDSIRIYFFTRDGTMVGAENIELQNYSKFEKQLKKSTKKIFTIPHISADEMLEERKSPYHKKIKKMKKVKVNLSQLEARFKRTFEELKRKTRWKAKLPSITLEDLNLEDNRRFFSKKVKESIYYSLKILNSDLLDGVIIRDCLIELIPDYFGEIILDLASFGAYLTISKSEKKLWLQKWVTPPLFREYLDSKYEIEDFFKKINYIINYFDENEKKSEVTNLLIKKILGNFNSSVNLIARSFFNELYENTRDEMHLNKRILFEFYEYKRIIIIEEKIDDLWFNCTALLVQYKINEFRKCLNSLNSIPNGLNRLFTSILESLKPFELHQEIIKDERLENQRLFIRVIFKNKSDLIFEILDFSVPESSNIGKYALPKEIPQKIYPFEERSIQLMINLSEQEIAKIKPLKIKIRDDSQNLYKLKSNSINL